MKNSILASIFFLIIILFSACQARKTKVKNAEDKVQEATTDLADAKTDLYLIRLDTISNYEQFKIEAEKIIDLQEKNIAEFKAKLVAEKMELNTDYNQKLLVLENQNSEFKKKLTNYKEDGKDTWIEFKNELNHDMNKLGIAFKNLTVENIK